MSVKTKFIWIFPNAKIIDALRRLFWRSATDASSIALTKHFEPLNKGRL